MTRRTRMRYRRRLPIRRSVFALLAAFAAAMLPGSVAAAGARQVPFAEGRTFFQAWRAGCETETGYCGAEAFAYHDDRPTVVGARLQLGRSDTGGLPGMSVVVFANPPAATSPVTLSVDGKLSITLLPGVEWRQADHADIGTRLDFMDTRELSYLVAAMGPGRWVRLGFVDEAGQERTHLFSLWGFTDALGYVETRLADGG